MKILVSQIDPNPHRDLERNPISEEQVAKIIESMKQTGFWDNVVVRPHPQAAGRYQLAYGHNRIAACHVDELAELDELFWGPSEKGVYPLQCLSPATPARSLIAVNYQYLCGYQWSYG